MNKDDTSPLKDIVFRLGGLQTSMSFLGSIEHFMTSSGLQSMLESVYVENTVPYVEWQSNFSSSAWSSVSGCCTMCNNHVRNVQLPITVDSEKESSEPPELFNLADNLDLLKITDLLDKSISGEVSAEDIEREKVFRKLIEKINSYKEHLASSRTANLWVQYIEMVEILCNFIKAERAGNFSHFHLQAINDMLPFIAASGHSLYAKSAYMYLKTMSSLQEKHPNVYRKFKEGFNFVRRTDNFGRDCQQTLLLSKFL